MKTNILHWTENPELLEQYILGNILQEERVVLEKHLQECEQCKTLVTQELSLAEGIRAYGRKKMKGKLAQHIERENRNPLQRYLVSLAAAVVIMIGGIAVYQMWFGPMQFPQKFGSTQYVFKEVEEKNISDKKIEEKKSEEPIKEKQQLEEISDIAESTVETERLNEEKRENLAFKDEDKTITSAPSVNNISRRAMWIVGTVVPISVGRDRSMPSAATQSFAEGLQKRDNFAAKKSKSETQKVNLAVKNTSQNIVLEQRPSNTLQTKNIAAGIQTLVEETDDGIALTLYPDSLFTSTELENAIVENISDDSLIVHISNQSIVYHLPQEFSVQNYRMNTNKKTKLNVK